MDQSDLNLIKMLQQAFLTGGVGPLDQSPDLPTLGFSSMRQSAGLSPYPATESTHIKTPTPEQLIQQLIERRQSGAHGPMSTVYDPHTSLDLQESALSHVPVDWKGRRQSENVEMQTEENKRGVDIENLFSWFAKNLPIPKDVLTSSRNPDRISTIRQLFPKTPASLAPYEYTEKHRPPTQFTPTEDEILRSLMKEEEFWAPEDYPDLRRFLD